MLNELNIGYIFLSAFIVNNIVMIKFLGLCSFVGISTNMKSSIGMGIAVVFVTVMACGISWANLQLPADTLSPRIPRTVTFILTIASFVQFEEIIIRKKALRFTRRSASTFP